MKGFGLSVVVVVLVVIGVSFEGCTSTASNPDLMNSIGCNIAWTTLTSQSRKLKENFINPSNKDDDMNLEDYNSVDPVPVPSSTASIRPGPIQHGSPQIPYIPKPPPPAPTDQPRVLN